MWFRELTNWIMGMSGAIVSMFHQVMIKVVDYMDIVAAGFCLLGAFCCLILMQVILKERSPLINYQRAALGALGIAMFFNASVWWPDWALIEGHRPTGILVNIFAAILLTVMVIRGRMVMQDHKENGDAQVGA